MFSTLMQNKDNPDEGVAAGAASVGQGKTDRRETQPTVVGAGDSLRHGSGVRRLTADGDGNCLPSPLIGHGIIAAGGMGVVHRVREPVLDRYVASKILRPERVSARLDDFLVEARILARLEHPNIVPVYGFGRSREGNIDRFQMKLVEGQSLHQRIATRRDVQLKPSDVIEFLGAFKQVCDALSFAHSRGVIHRDIKPDNIMVGTFGQVYVMDWGIALLKGEHTESGNRVVGTPPYMAPEQFRGCDDDIDGRTDVFGLGATLYEFLTGVAPHAIEGQDDDKLFPVQRAPLVPPDIRAPNACIPALLNDIAVCALQPDPRERFQSVAELKEAVQKFLNSGAWAERVPVEAGEIVCRAGDAGDCVYFVEHGHFDVLHEVDGVPVRTLGPGDCFGELSLLLHTPRTATVVAKCDGALLRLSAEVFDSALPEGSWLRKMTLTMAERFIDIDGQKN